MPGIALTNQFAGVIGKRRLLRSWEFEVEFHGEGLRINPVYVNSTSFPGRAVSDIELPIGGTTMKYPGPPVYDSSWTVTFRDTFDLSVRKALDRYIGQIAWYESRPRFQPQMTVIVRPVDPVLGGNTMIVLENAYISNIGDATMEYSNEALATYEVTFNYHRWYFK